MFSEMKKLTILLLISLMVYKSLQLEAFDCANDDDFTQLKIDGNNNCSNLIKNKVLEHKKVSIQLLQRKEFEKIPFFSCFIELDYMVNMRLSFLCA